jgi:hypothetical protein
VVQAKISGYSDKSKNNQRWKHRARGGEAVIKIGSKVETYQWENKFLGDSSYTYPILLQETGCEKIEISVSTKYKDKKVKEKRSIPFSCGD